MRVITYQFAYDAGRTIDLCPRCAERDDDHGGALGAVQHGLHNGSCESPRHGLTITQASEDRSRSAWHALGSREPGRYVQILASEVPLSIRFDVPARHQGQPHVVAYGGWSRAEHGKGDPFMRTSALDDPHADPEYYRWEIDGRNWWR